MRHLIRVYYYNFRHIKSNVLISTDVSILSMTKDVFIQNIFNTYRYILIVFKCRSKLNFPLVIVVICLCIVFSLLLIRVYNS